MVEPASLNPAMQIYDALGTDYRRHRRPDPRLQAAIDAALAGARTVVNVGAGAGSYEPVDRRVVAVEPSERMARQRPAGSAPVALAVAEALPFADGVFDAAMAVLTLHHWRDWRAGVGELRRVARRTAILTWDPAHAGFWLVADYFPDLLAHDRRIFPPITALQDALGGGTARVVPVPHDCTDGFLGAYWRRPERYLDAGARGAISSFARVQQVRERLERLATDLADGTWQRRHGALGARDELDLGYRLVVADAAGCP